MFACDYNDSNSLGQLKDSHRLRAYIPELSHRIMTDLIDAQQLQIQPANCDSPQCDPAVSITRPMCGNLPKLPVSSVELNNTEQTDLTALKAQQTEQRHLYEPLIGASRKCQVVPETTPTALLAGAGTTKVSAHPAHAPQHCLGMRSGLGSTLTSIFFP